MGSLFSLTWIYLSVLLLTPAAETLEIKSAEILDLVIRNYTLRSYNNSNNNNSFKTGKVYEIDLPESLSGINVATVRLRCGSLQRYGAKVKEFFLNRGVNVHPCIERVILVRQSISLGSNWSALFDLSGYQLISPILTLLAYNVEGSSSNVACTFLGTPSGISVDFTSTTLLNASSRISPRPLCARFDVDGKVSLWDQERPNVCAGRAGGRFGLVVESPLKGEVVSKVKIVVVGSIGAALGAFLLSLLMIAMCVNAKKKKARMDELERRAYEEEALQVSMVGHVRAVTAAATRTPPTIEQHDYRMPHFA